MSRTAPLARSFHGVPPRRSSSFLRARRPRREWSPDRSAARCRVEPNVLALHSIDARAGDDHVHFFLLRLLLVVLPPCDVRRNLEPVDPERADAEMSTDEADSAARPLRRKVVDLHHRVAHYSSFSRLSSRCRKAWRMRSPSASTCW